MKYLLFVLLLVVILVTAGCVQRGQISNQTPTVQPTPTTDTAAATAKAVADAADIAVDRAKHDAAFAKPVATPVLEPILPLVYASDSPTQKCIDTMACITRSDSEPLNRKCADLILPLLRYELGLNPCFNDTGWYPFNRDTSVREMARCTFGQGESNICFEVTNAIKIGQKRESNSATTYSHTYDPCRDAYDSSCPENQVRYYGVCMAGVKIVCRPVYQP